jgi:hypothetical protein
MSNAYLVRPYLKEIQDKLIYLKAFRFSLAREFQPINLGTSDGEEKLEAILSFKVVGRTIAEILDNYFNVCFYMLEPFKRTDRLRQIQAQIQRHGNLDQFRGMPGMADSRKGLATKKLEEMGKEIEKLEIACGRLDQFLNARGIDQARWGPSQSENAFHGWVESLVESYISFINICFPLDANHARRTFFLEIIREAARVTLQSITKPPPKVRVNPGPF